MYTAKGQGAAWQIAETVPEIGRDEESDRGNIYTNQSV
jgi:hypothetical protein